MTAYQENPASAGVVVGRVAGRIADGQLKIGGRRYQLDQNEGANTLHGGAGGFGWQDWQFAGKGAFKLSSPNGDQGFPGRVDIWAAYSMPEPLTLRLDLKAKARATTPLNLTHHPYWLLNEGALEIGGQEAQVVDQNLIATGPYAPFLTDLSKPLDHCVRLSGEGLRKIATLRQPEITMEVWADTSHLQVYNGQPGTLCLEPQEANNQPEQQLLHPGKIWTRRIEYRFYVSD